MHNAIAFILELDKLKGVTRKTRPIGLDRFENSAEHSWHIALFAHALAVYAPAGCDINRVIRMLLVHDIGEIDAGDVLVYAEGDPQVRKAEELAGVRRVCALLPPARSQPLIALWEEFDAGETPEARFANALDRAMPALLNLHNNGQSWVEHGITYERVVARIGPPIEAGCPELWAYLDNRLSEAKAAGWFGMG